LGCLGFGGSQIVKINAILALITQIRVHENDSLRIKPPSQYVWYPINGVNHDGVVNALLPVNLK
jgi:hypothetical protein